MYALFQKIEMTSTTEKYRQNFKDGQKKERPHATKNSREHMQEVVFLLIWGGWV